MKRGSMFDTIYGIVRMIPESMVTTYGQIARMAGMPRGARIVGGAMNARIAPDGPPYHRVVKAGGILPPEEIFAGAQRPMLEAEGVTFLPDGRVDMSLHFWAGDQEEC